MKNKKLITLLAVALAASSMLSACGFGNDDEDEPTVVVSETPTPAPTVAVATPTPVPQNTKYTSSNGSISIELPNSTWSNKMDEGDTISFESTAGDRILILHGAGEEAMSEAVLPDTRDNASVLTASADVVEGTDFEINDYKAEQKNGANVYSYTVKYLDTAKGGGYADVFNYVVANDQEFYSLAGSVKSESTLAAVQASIKTFTIKDEASTLKNATGTTTSGTSTSQTGGNSSGTTDNTAGNANTAGTSGGSTEDTAGSSTGSTDTGSTDTSYSGGSGYGSGYSMDLYTSGGVAFGIWQDASGTWIDGDGNSFWFDGNGVAYDQYGNAYSQAGSYGYDYSSGTDYYEDTNTNYDNNYTGSGSMDLYTGGGVAFGIWQDANGTWIDGDGHSFTFDGNGVAYDQYGNAYYQ